MLLPAPEEEGEEDDPRRELVRKLVEYRKIKEAARALSGREEDRRRHFPHGVDPETYEALWTDELETEVLLRDVTLFDLVDSLREVLSRVPRRIDVHEVDLEQVTVEEKMESIQQLLATSRTARFAQLFESSRTRTEVVTAFIALLELIRLGIVTATQERNFGEIVITLTAEVVL